MRQPEPRNMLDQAFGFAVSAVVIAWLLAWAWRLTQPLLPLLLVVAVVIVVIRIWLVTSRSRW